MDDRTEHAALREFEELVEASGNDRNERLETLDQTEPKVASRIRSLLAALESSVAFLDAPAVTLEPPSPSSINVPGYTVLRIIASGGMATVYEARQHRPDRLVALKVLHLALHSPSVLRRFEFETEILARLRHPSIAAIYEAGVCSDQHGRSVPYFAMELVEEARSIVRHVHEGNFDRRAALALFVDVCDAVHHGHRLGVIHRDLKPSNILVGFGGRPRVIDFGVARSVHTDGEGVTDQLDAGQLIGTLHAMSPEQCLTPSDVDVRTDVYSLGVILYQLVLGRPPLDLSAKSIPDAVRSISEDDPMRPLRVLPSIGRDLDAIITTAIAKDREHRYSSVNALAADIRRYMANKPIEARPVSALAQLLRLADRNRALSSAIAAAVVLLFAGTTVSTYLAYSATKARDESRARQAELENAMSFQEDQLASIDVRVMGESIRDDLRAWVSDEQRDSVPAELMLQEANFTSIALGAIDRQLARSLLAIESQFADRPTLRARMLQQLASTMSRLGLSSDAEPLLRDALAIREQELGAAHPETLQTLHSLGSVLATLGRYDEAVDMLDRTHGLQVQSLGPDDPSTLATATSLGGALRRQGNLDEAGRVWQDAYDRLRRTVGPDDPATLRVQHNIGVALAASGQLDEAEIVWRDALERRRRVFGAQHPLFLSTLGNLGGLLQNKGDLAGAREMIEDSLAADRETLGDTHPNTLISMTQLAALLEEIGELSEAEELQREVYETRRDVLGEDNPATLLAGSRLASILIAADRWAEAEPLLTDALPKLRELLGVDYPGVIYAASVLVTGLAADGRIDDAMQVALDTHTLVSQRLPEGHPIRGATGAILGQVLAEAGQPEEAEAILREAHRVLLEALGADHPQTRQAARLLAANKANAMPSRPDTPPQSD